MPSVGDTVVALKRLEHLGLPFNSYVEPGTVGVIKKTAWYYDVVTFVASDGKPHDFTCAHHGTYSLADDIPRSSTGRVFGAATKGFSSGSPTTARSVFVLIWAALCLLAAAVLIQGLFIAVQGVALTLPAFIAAILSAYLCTDWSRELRSRPHPKPAIFFFASLGGRVVALLASAGVVALLAWVVWVNMRVRPVIWFPAVYITEGTIRIEPLSEYWRLVVLGICLTLATVLGAFYPKLLDKP